MSKVIDFKVIKNNYNDTKIEKSQKQDKDYFKLIDKLSKSQEYVENNIKINDIKNILVNQYEVPYNIVAMLIDNVNEKVAMEYEAEMPVV